MQFLLRYKKNKSHSALEEYEFTLDFLRRKSNKKQTFVTVLYWFNI